MLRISFIKGKKQNFNKAFGVMSMKKNDFSNVNEVKNKGVLNFKSIMMSVGISYLIALVLFLILALCVTYTSFKEEDIKIAVSVINAITVILSGALVCKNARTLGWLNGGIEGVIYTVILFLISFLIFDNLSFGLSFILSIVFSFLLGAVGGIIGINLKK